MWKLVVTLLDTFATFPYRESNPQRDISLTQEEKEGRVICTPYVESSMFDIFAFMWLRVERSYTYSYAGIFISSSRQLVFSFD